MLESIGNALRKATDKIASAVFVDKKLLESVAKELQRALISADVNIQLVKELTDKIKSEGEKYVKNVDKKEHLIKLLNDEIINIIGKEKKELKIEKKEKILFIGLYGTGKCIHGESKIQLSNGEMPKIKDFYNQYKQIEKEDILEDGTIINISHRNITLPSFNSKTGKIENKKATHIWKLKKDNLFEVFLNNGNDYSIKVTPEHPFFVLRNGIITKIRADEISHNDYIAIPNNLEIESEEISLIEDIKRLNLFIYLTQEETKELIKSQNKTLTNINETLKYKHNYCQFTSNIKMGKIPIQLIEKLDTNIINIKGHNDKKIITLPLFLTRDFAEFLGYIIGDGNIRKEYIQISNEDPEIINRIEELSKILFNIKPAIKKAKRTKNMYNIRICSRTLVKISGIFGLKPGKKGKTLEIPKQIMLSNNEIIRAFLQAYFDCDSYPSVNRDIEITSESQILIQQINMLLQRTGILSTISKKYVKEKSYWRLSIKSRYAEKYAEKIGYIIKRKKEKVNNYKNIGIIQGCGSQDMIPLGKLLKELRIHLGFSIGEIQTNAVYSYGRYEENGLISREKLLKLITYYRLNKTGIFFNLLNDIENKQDLMDKYSRQFLNGSISYLKENDLIKKEENNLFLSQKSKQYLQSQDQINPEKLITYLEMLATSNVCWIPIKNVQEIKNEEDYVYDLTVEDNHNFIAEGFIVHNTTTIAKIATYYKKRGRNIALLGLDIHRPAAPEQLEQLAKQIDVPVFVDKFEKDPIKIYKRFEKQLEKYDMILIDSAGRDALEKSLIKEIKEISNNILPTHTLLVIAADIGQAVKNQVQEFQKACNINGVIITRMDSSAKAGGALTACAEIKAPVYFIGTGEKIGDLEIFNPKSFVSRILGMGDLESLLERVKSATDEKIQKKLQKQLESGKFTLDDFASQLESMQGLGSFSKIKELIPGFGKAKVPDELLETQENKMKKWKFAISSMTQKERENPEILEKQTSRISRIAKGSGVSTTDIRQMLKQFKLIKEFASGASDMQNMDMSSLSDPTKLLSNKKLMKMARKLGKKKMMRL